jgi:hypothetical protein
VAVRGAAGQPSPRPASTLSLFRPVPTHRNTLYTRLAEASGAGHLQPKRRRSPGHGTAHDRPLHPRGRVILWRPKRSLRLLPMAWSGIRRCRWPGRKGPPWQERPALAGRVQEVQKCAGRDTCRLHVMPCPHLTRPT